MRSCALRPLVLCALTGMLLISPAARALDAPARPVPHALGAADPLASRLEEMRATLTEIEQQREVVWSLRERTFRVMQPGRLPSDARYPDSVLCRDGGVVYPAQPSATARAFCAGDAAGRTSVE